MYVIFSFVVLRSGAPREAGVDCGDYGQRDRSNVERAHSAGSGGGPRGFRQHARAVSGWDHLLGARHPLFEVKPCTAYAR